MLQLDRHSLSVLGTLYNYDTFLESLRTICDMGCGTGDDITWWATLETKDEPSRPYNYKCYAVDHDQRKLDQVPNLTNIIKICKDFSQPFAVPVSIDLLWSHDSLQYSTNPLETLRAWNEQMTVNGMLVLCIPQANGVEYNKYYARTYSGCYYNFTPTNLIYMLAVNGFDCADAYLLKKFNDPWIHIAVYKSNVAPMDPKQTSWLDLVETGLLHPSVANSIYKNGYLRQEEIVYPWLDKENYFIDWISLPTEIPAEAGEPKIEGVFNTSQPAEKSLVQQPSAVTKETPTMKPVGVLRPPKGRYVK